MGQHAGSAAAARRVVGLEEHLVTTAVLDSWTSLDARWQDLSLVPSRHGQSGRLLADLGDERLASMDAVGVDVAVLSLTTPGVQNLDPAQAIGLQRDVNDLIAEQVQRRPDRFAGWATLATSAPEAAAEELHRAVTTLDLDGAMIFGRTRDDSLDHPRFRAILEAADELRAPLYLHPQSPPAAVRDAYYRGFGDVTDAAFATHGVGWHYDTGVQIIRLVLAGVFDRYPHLQIVTGHWGELILFYLERIDQLAPTAHLPRRPSEYLRDHLHVTPSGVLSRRYLHWARDVLGIDRILFATDYPFVPLDPGAATDFLTGCGLTDAERNGVAAANWDRLIGGIHR